MTVAFRRVDIDNPADDTLREIDRERYLLLPNTSGARTAKEAIRLARLALAATGIEWLKLEVTPDPYYLLPCPIETLKAAKILVKEGFVVLPYINADPILAKRLQDVGTATVMPLGSPIGSNQGLKTRGPGDHHRAEQRPRRGGRGAGPALARRRAMEIGADAVLVNTAIATAGDPVEMAVAFKLAVEAGRRAFMAGHEPRREMPMRRARSRDF